MENLPEEKSPPLPSPTPPPESSNDVHHAKVESKAVESAAPLIEHAVQQALLYQKTVEQTVESAIEASRSRYGQIRSTSSIHFDQTIDYLRDLKSEYGVYEAMFFGKIKEGINIAVSNPLISGGVLFGLGSITMKRPRRFLYYKTYRLFVNEEAMLSRADTKVKELRQSIDKLKAESVNLEKSSKNAEEALIRGQTKLRAAGKQIQSAVRSAYKIERQAAGLKDALGDLPLREASRFRSQVSKLASEVKQERNALTKEVTKISNYGISI